MSQPGRKRRAKLKARFDAMRVEARLLGVPPETIKNSSHKTKHSLRCFRQQIDWFVAYRSML